MKQYDDLAIIILAAGKGTRMKSNESKVLHTVGSKSMIINVIESSKKITEKNIYVVVGYQAKKIQNEINKYFNVNFVLQKELDGTGSAVKTAIPLINHPIKDIVVLCGDTPLIKEKTIIKLIKNHRNNDAKITILSAFIDNPKGYGRIIMDDSNNIKRIVEEVEANIEEKKIKAINTGIYCFDKEFIRNAIKMIRKNNSKKEYYLTDIVEIAKNENKKIRAVFINDIREIIGVNTQEDLKKANLFLNHKI